MNFYGFFITISINLAYSQKTPSISYITQKMIKDIGDSVNLKCIVINADEFPVEWMKIDREKKTDAVPITAKSSIIIPDSRFQLVQHECKNSTCFYELQINNIQETNIGYYRCIVRMDSINKIFADVELVVRQPTTISDSSTRSLVVVEGRSVTMECHAGGHPRPRIWWRRANNAILQGGRSMHRGNVLEIFNVTKEDRGTYYCCAENGVRRGDRRRVNVEVLFAPVITVPKTPLEQALQYDVDAECRVEAYPLPSIIWFKDGQNITDSQHYRIHQSASEDEVTETTLRIITIEKRQYGIYRCRASNILGTAEATVQIDETITPVCPPACKDNDTEEKSSSIKSASTSLPYLVFILHIVVLFNF